MNMHALEITNLALTARREPDKIWLSKPVIQKNGDTFLFCIYHTLSLAIK